MNIDVIIRQSGTTHGQIDMIWSNAIRPRTLLLEFVWWHAEKPFTEQTLSMKHRAHTHRRPIPIN